MLSLARFAWFTLWIVIIGCSTSQNNQNPLDRDPASVSGNCGSDLEKFTNEFVTQKFENKYGKNSTWNKVTRVQDYQNLWPDPTQTPNLSAMNSKFRALYESSNDDAHVYLDKVFASYTPEELQKLENASLQRSLGRRGVTNVGHAPRKVLEQISRRNLERITQKKRYLSGKIPAMNEAEKIVHELELSFYHNSKMSGQTRITPTLSSKQLEEAGLGAGANTQEYFNRNFLATDDQVFFWAGSLKPRSKKLSSEIASSEYGTKAFVPEARYAREHGWISAFVMSPDDLESNVATHVNPTALAELKRKYGGVGQALKMHPLPAELEEIRRSIYMLDFIVSDFEHLVKSTLLDALNELRLTDPETFQKTISTLKEDRNDVVERLVYDRLNLTTSWEFKIPVMVPAEKFISQ